MLNIVFMMSSASARASGMSSRLVSTRSSTSTSMVELSGVANAASGGEKSSTWSGAPVTTSTQFRSGRTCRGYLGTTAADMGVPASTATMPCSLIVSLILP